MVSNRWYNRDVEHICNSTCRWVAVEERNGPPQWRCENAHPTQVSGDDQPFPANDRDHRVVNYITDHIELMSVDTDTEQIDPKKYAPSAANSESTLTEACTIPTLVEENQIRLTESTLHLHDEQIDPSASSKATGRSKSHATELSSWSWEAIPSDPSAENVASTGAQFDEEAASPHGLDRAEILVIDGIDD